MAKSGVKGREKALLRVSLLEDRIKELESKLDIIEDGVLEIFLEHNHIQFPDASMVVDRLRAIMAQARDL